MASTGVAPIPALINSTGTCLQQLLACVPGEVEQRVDFGDRHALGARGEFDDLVACLYLALFEHAEVEAWTMM
jgi:hypothetical protein